MDNQTTGAGSKKTRQEMDTVTIRFAGDSGDGMQLTGTEFTRASAVAGNDLQTFPDYPAEIRAPAGTIGGVSGFQIQFASHPVFTPGDAPDVLVAMNPAALKANLGDLKPGALLIVNTGAFTEHNLQKAGYTTNPLEDGSLDKYRVHLVDITLLTQNALADSGLGMKEIARSKNMFALGLMLWMFQRPTGPSVAYLEKKFKNKPAILAANKKVLEAGYAYGETAELFEVEYEVKPAAIERGTYRNVSGNEAVALGIVASAELASAPVFLGSYPITPATDILHEVAKHKNFDVTTFQAEDEIAGICSSIGASYGGAVAFTTTSGPGMALKTEAMGLAVMTELPLVIVNVQRGGPSTGLPTKTEQADLLQALYGRNGESPIPVIAIARPSDAFECTLEATRVALKYMTPVILLSDGFIANGMEPWKLPAVDQLPRFPVHYRTNPEGYMPYGRDEVTLARAWVRPGTPGMEHRIGGIEKDVLTGAISYSPANHEKMVRIRAEKVARIANEIPACEVHGDKERGVLVVGWGSTFGPIQQAVKNLRAQGKPVSHLHLRWLNPLPRDLGEVLKRYDKVVVPEMNLGQLVRVLRERYLVDAQGINKVQGKPFKVAELQAKIEEHL